MRETATTLPKLLMVREIQQDENGVTLRFQEGRDGRLVPTDANYANHLRLARRGLERHHPLAARIGAGERIVELVRADNDVPAELIEENSDEVGVIFHGHDGVFHLKADHPEAARLRGVLDEAIQRKARLWFVAHKPDLSILDILPSGGEASSSFNGNGNGFSTASKST